MLPFQTPCDPCEYVSIRPSEYLPAFRPKEGFQEVRFESNRG